MSIVYANLEWYIVKLLFQNSSFYFCITWCPRPAGSLCDTQQEVQQQCDLCGRVQESRAALGWLVAEKMASLVRAYVWKGEDLSLTPKHTCMTK